MELTPQTLHAVEFREARRGGYNTRDVDDFLERVAAGVALLQDRLRDVMARAEGAEGRLADMQRQLEETQRRPAAPEVSETDDTLRRTLVLAQRTADATIKEAKDEAARLVSDARDELARTRSEIEEEARRGTEDARRAAEAEIEHLLEARDALNGDIDALNHHIEQQRDQVRAGIAELERALDEPSGLRSMAAPALTDVERPIPAPPSAPPRIEVPAAAGPRASLPMRKPQPAELANGNGAEPADLPTPFLPGSQIAALQEAPPLPSRSPEPSQASPPQPSPFTFTGEPDPGRPVASPWPSELRTSVSDAGSPPGDDGQPPDGPNGAVDGIGIEPGSRPSEWGKPVFDRDDEPDHQRFGRQA
jgi:cell division initiation protein